MIAIFITAMLGIIAAQIAPGPNLLAVASVALSQGRQPAICVAAGVATGVLIWVSAFALGVAVVFQKFPLAGIVLQILGGGYFLWVASKAIISAWRAKPSMIETTAQTTTLSDAYKRGLFVVLTNPKAAFMWAAVSAFLVGSGFSTNEVLLIAPIGSATSFIIYGSYGWLFSTATANRVYQRFSRGLELVFGLCFGAIGARLVFDGIQSAQSD